MIMIPEEIRICEVSTRDGFQGLPFEVDTEEKLILLELMADAGIQEIEVGSFVPGKNAGLWKMSRTPEVFRKMKRRDGIVYRALLQTPEGAAEAVDNGCEKFKINISGSEKHYALMTGSCIAEGMQGFSEIGRIASRNRVTLLGSISLAFLSPYDGKIPLDTLRMIIRRFLDCGVTEVSLNDTAGMATPALVRDYFRCMMAEFPEVSSWAFHPHNTRGMGLANTLAAMDAGVTRVDASLAGIGGCSVFKNASGNISTEDLLYMLDGMGIRTGVNMEKALIAGDMVRNMIRGNHWDSYIQRLEEIKRAESGIE